MVFGKYYDEKSAAICWKISIDMMRFQQIVPSQSPTNHPICFTLIYQLFRTKKKIYAAEFSAYMLNYQHCYFHWKLGAGKCPQWHIKYYLKKIDCFLNVGRLLLFYIYNASSAMDFVKWIQCLQTNLSILCTLWHKFMSKYKLIRCEECGNMLKKKKNARHPKDTPPSPKVTTPLNRKQFNVYCAF